MLRALITGGAGFIGSALVRRAIAADWAVLNIDKLTYAGRLETVAAVTDHLNYSFLRADVADESAINEAVSRFAPDVIFHLAAESHVDRSIDGPAVFIKTNIQGTYVMLEAALRYWSGLSPAARERFRFIQVSTDEVYGSLGDGGLFTEQSLYRPNSPYSASKAAGDHLARAWRVSYGLPTIVSHCSNNYGPFQHAEKLIPTVLRNAIAGQAIPVYGDGRNRRDWLYIEDHVAGLMLAAECGMPGRDYLFGGRAEIANIDLVHIVCGILDQQKPCRGGLNYTDQISLVTDRPGHDFRYATDPTSTENELGWSPQQALHSGLAATVAWYLANPGWMNRPAEQLARLGLGGRSR
jgi:dTDP-glucose 4,6-dehydratase